MPKWVEGTIVNQRRWTQTLFSLQVEADVSAFEAGQFAKLALAAEGEMVARPHAVEPQPGKNGKCSEHPCFRHWYATTRPFGKDSRLYMLSRAPDYNGLSPRRAIHSR